MDLEEVPHVMSFDWPNSLAPLIQIMEGKSLLNFCKAFGGYLTEKSYTNKIVIHQGSLTDEIFQAFLVDDCDSLHVITSTGSHIHSSIQFYRPFPTNALTLRFYTYPRRDDIIRFEESADYVKLIWEMYDRSKKGCYDPIQEKLSHVDVKLQVPKFLVPFLEYHEKVGTSSIWISQVLTHYLLDVCHATSVYVGSVEQPIFHAIGYWSKCPGDHGYYHYDILTMDLIHGGCISHGIKPGEEEPYDYGSWGNNSVNLAELKRVCKLLLEGEPRFPLSPLL